MLPAPDWDDSAPEHVPAKKPSSNPAFPVAVIGSLPEVDSPESTAIPVSKPAEDSAGPQATDPTSATPSAP